MISDALEDSLPSVDTLTDSDHDVGAPSLLPITELSGSEDDGGPASGKGLSRKWVRGRVAKQRRESSRKFKERLSSASFVKGVIGKKCFSCRYHCMDKFSAPQDFTALLQFRKSWAELHKLDQDRVVSGSGNNRFFSIVIAKFMLLLCCQVRYHRLLLDFISPRMCLE